MNQTLFTPLPTRAARLLAVAAAFTLATPGWCQIFSNIWSLKVGDRPYLAADNSHRGVAINPKTGNVILISRTGSPQVYVIDGQTGADIRTLSVEGVGGGTFAISMVGVADDGAIYAGNLSGSTTAQPTYKIYKWAAEDDPAAPQVLFTGDPAGYTDVGGSLNPQRWGDSLEVRGGGTNTQVLAASRNTTVMALFTYTNDVDPPRLVSQILTNAAGTSGSSGVAFGVSNRVWSKLNGQALRHAQYNPDTGVSTLLNSYTSTVIPGNVGPLGVQSTNGWLGGLQYDNHTVQFYDISDLSSGPPVELARATFPTANNDANAVGSVDFATVGDTNLAVALHSNNGIMMFRILPDPSATPQVVTPPAGRTVVEGASNLVFSVAAKGAKPLYYQWRLNETPIPNATNRTYTVPVATPAVAGNYSVVITNAAGTATSTNATLVVEPLVRSDALTKLWQIAPGARVWMATDNNQRGMARNPVNGNVLVVSRTANPTATNGVYVLNGETGAELRALNTDSAVVTGGTFALNLIGVADDGVVYGCNLVTDSRASQFVIYRWADDTYESVPAVAYVGDPTAGNTNLNSRFGDSFTVRGAGPNTQILAASRNGTNVALFTTTDGTTFSATPITTDAVAGSLGLGVAFGSGNSFWGKATGNPLRLIDFNPTAGTGVTRLTVSTNDVRTAVASIGTLPASNWLAGITIETPDNLRLFKLDPATQAPSIVDQELFPTDTDNANGTGAVAIGPNRLYALDSNNGLMAFTLKEPTKISAALSGGTVVLTWTASGQLVSAPTASGTYTNVTGATSPYPVTPTGAQAYFQLKTN